MKKRCTAVVLAAGAGKRMQSNVAKQYLLLNEKPVLWYALNTFEQSEVIDEIILVVGKDEIPYAREHIVDCYGFKKVSAVIEGGSERYFSVWEALQVIESSKAVSAEDEISYVFIHDGARPFVTEKILVDTYNAVSEYGACVTGMPVKDTIKIADENEFAVQTPNRKSVWLVQTPQVFERDLICKAYGQLIEKLPELDRQGVTITDDAMVVETIMNRPVRLVQGSYENIKITTPEDMDIAEVLLKKYK